MVSKLSIAEANRLKGLLILLVILGHIGALPLMTLFLLYSFHVTSFLFLPFLFNKDKLTLTNISKIFRRYYVPYLLFFTFSLVVYLIMIDNNFDFYKVLAGLIIGTSMTLKSSIGFSLYWYFPTLISLLVLIMLYNSMQANGKKIILLSTIISHLFLPLLPIDVLQMTPFYLFASLYLFSLGILIKTIYEADIWRKVPWIVYLLGLSILLYLAYGSSYNLAKSIIPDIVNEPYNFILHDIIIVFGFFTIVKVSRYFVFLEQAGVYSIAIYTIHPFVIQLFNRLASADTIGTAIMKFIFVSGISYLMAWAIYKIPIHKYIYPR